MEDIVRILHVEDVESDAELIERVLRKGNLLFEKIVVDNRQDFIAALTSFKPDIVVSDHSLPAFDSMEALTLLKSIMPGTPFILVTSTISEEFAVEIMKMGADDYVLKDRLQRLPNAVINAITNRRLERERIESEANLKTIFNNTDAAYILFTPQQQVVSFNNQAKLFTQELFGKPLEKGAYAAGYFPGKRMPFVDKAFADAINGEITSYENSFFDKNGEVKWYYSKWFGTMDEAKINHGVMLSITDITERKQAELERVKITQDIVQRNNALEQFAYIVSHNLRAPVANIIALSNSLANDETEDDEQKEIFIKALNSSAQKLDDVVLDLNHILRISQRINEKMEVVYFQQVVDDVKASLARQISSEGAMLITNFSSAMNIYTLKSYLYNIFLSIIHNSLMFKKTTHPPLIEIESRNAGTNVEISFRDNGKGIDLDKFGNKIFGLYQRFDTSVDGRGVSLCMVKTQVETLGGSIEVQSQVNRGATFTILLPV